MQDKIINKNNFGKQSTESFYDCALLDRCSSSAKKESELEIEQVQTEETTMPLETYLMMTKKLKQDDTFISSDSLEQHIEGRHSLRNSNIFR